MNYLIDAKKADENKKIKQRQQNDNDEETLTYMKRERKVSYLNTEKDAFESIFGGINSNKSVFDRTAVFNTQTGDSVK